MLSFVLIFILTFAAIIFLYSLVSHRLEGTMVTAPMVFVAAGLLFSPAALDWVDVGKNNMFILIIAEIALVLTLFSDASRINFRALKQGAVLPARLLFIGLPLTIILGALVATGLFSGITLAEAALLGAILAPTDAGLGQAIVNSPLIPVRIRQTLNVESGLNDGGALPFFYLFIFLAGESFLGVPETSWLRITLALIGIGIIVGLIVGFFGGWLVDAAVRKKWMTGKYEWIGFLSMALIAWLAAETLGGSGFIAAFVAGLATAAFGRRVGEAVLTFTEAGGEILDLAIFFILGLVAPVLLTGLTGTVILYAVLSLTFIRMIPVAISLIGTRLNRKTVLFIGWFGPRGLASIVLLLIVFEEAPAIPGLVTLQTVIVATIMISVFAHGISSTPLIGRYARIIQALPDGSPEKEEVPLSPTRRKELYLGEKEEKNPISS